MFDFSSQSGLYRIVLEEGIVFHSGEGKIREDKLNFVIGRINFCRECQMHILHFWATLGNPPYHHIDHTALRWKLIGDACKCNPPFDLI